MEAAERVIMAKIETRSIEDLLPDPNNVNKHTQKGHKLVENSISRRGVGRGILAAGKNTDKPVIMAGNLTHEKARDAGIDEVVFVHTTGNQLVVTVRDDLDPTSPEAIALGIEDNEAGKQSYNADIDLLAAMSAGDNGVLSALKRDDKIFGDMLAGMGIKESEPVDAEPQIDRAAELAEKWQTKSGQLWKLGEHRLLVGDCTVRENVERLMGGERADLVVTSPPYNQGNNWGEFLGSSDKKMYAHSEDDMSEAEYSEFIFLVLNRCFEIVNDIHTIAWNVAYNAKSRDSYGKILFSDKNPFTVKETIVWDKHSAINLTAIGIYSRRCEFVFIMSSGDKYLTNQKKGEARWNYWETKKPQQLEGHRATFPVEFAERPIFELSFEKNIVYEPFAGSGTTIIAAHNLNRRCYAMEISEKYGAVILERFFTATGITPELVTE